MANPTLLTMPLCVNADKNTIPPTDAGTSGLFSEELGFQDINSLPLASGGKAPNRRDFNGVFALLGGIAYACQRGYTFEWVNNLPYLAGCVVTDPLDGNKYNAKNDVAEGGTNPSLDPTNWEKFGIDTTVLANTDLSNLTATGLNAFATKTLSNLDTSNLTYHLVVDSYYDDATGDWYRVYDDGWVEQGSKYPSIASTPVTINFLKPFSGLPTTLLKTSDTAGNSTLGASWFSVYNVSSTSFRSYNDGSNGMFWFACGMGANS